MDGGHPERRTRDTAARRARLAEAAAWIVAVALAVLVVARVASTARAALLFADGDSMLPVLVMRSIEAGQRQDWAMSSVLFIPELLVFGAVWALRIGGSAHHVDATVAVVGVLNVVALFAVLRVAAGRRARAAAPIAGALLAFAAFAVLSVLDSTSSRDSLELASLLTTATYYSATVIALVLSIGFVRRILDGSRRRLGLLVALGLVVAVSVLSNPLFLIWATAPLCLLLVVWGARHRLGGRRDELLWIAGVVAVSSVVGYLGRIPLAPFIANDGLGYIDVTRMGPSAAYYAGLAGQLASTPAGAASLVLTALLATSAVVCSIRLRGTDHRGAAFVATAGWVIPVVVLVAAIVLGTHAARYLQPVVYGPIVALAVLPDVLVDARRVPVPRIRPVPGSVAAAAAVAVVALAVAVGVPRLASAVTRDDAALACVTRWVDSSGRTGAGQYWTVRLPKAHVADPRTLVQVDDTLRPYDWLVDRADADVGRVTFLLLDDQSPPFTLPGGATLDEAQLVSCGRYTIADFGATELPLGAPRS